MKRPFAESIQRLQDSRFLAPLFLAAVIAAHLFSVVHIHPASLFGLSQDDTLYFSSAQALAEGRGYILPSLPGAPAATKYPILYPWLLSLVWRLNPHFPANLTWAVALTSFFSLAAIFLCYFFCRLPLRLPRLQSLFVTAFFALHPTFIFYSARLMTDVPFTALTLAFLLSAWQAMGRESPGQPNRQTCSATWLVVSGLFAALCVAMRLAGIAFVGGMLLALLLRKLWQPAAIFLSSCIPAFAYFIYQSWLRTPSPPPAPFSPNLPGWTQTWLYYTSYAAFRRLDSPDLHSTLVLLLNQLLYLVSSIAGYFVSPLSDANIALWFIATLLVFLLFATALGRGFLPRSEGPTPAILFAYILLLAAWDHVEWGRFLLPFLPWMLVGILREGRAFLANVRGAGSDMLTKSLYGCAALCAAGLLLATAWNFLITDRRPLAEARRIREATLPEKAEAFGWIRAHATPGERVIATEDGLAYFYTGQQSISGTIFAPYDVYDPARLRRDLDHMADAPLALNAKYWVITDQDSLAPLHALGGPVRTRLDEFESLLPLLFRSRGGTVRVYDAGCLQSSCNAKASQSERH